MVAKIQERMWLQEIRKNKGLLQYDVAKAVGVALSTYAMYEQGRRTPNVKTASKIGVFLDFDWQLFFKEQLHESCQKILA